EELAKLAPNLHSDAASTWAALETKMQDTLNHLEELKQNIKTLKETFAKVKPTRLERFQTAFLTVSKNIDAIYRRLTRTETGNLVTGRSEGVPSAETGNWPTNETGSRGPVANTTPAALVVYGQAFLIQEDSEEPYMAGIRYQVMPPLKAFRDMAQ